MPQATIVKTPVKIANPSQRNTDENKLAKDQNGIAQAKGIKNNKAWSATKVATLAIKKI